MSNHSFAFSMYSIQTLLPALILLLIIQLFDTSAIRNNTPSPSDIVPTILELQLYSNNTCSPNLAVDNDRITCEFTLAKPCYDINALAGTLSSSGYLFCIRPDHRHWCFVLQIRNEYFPDQSRISADTLLRQIFSNNYRYYGSCNDIIYLAPVKISYQISQPASSFPIQQNSGLPPVPPPNTPFTSIPSRPLTSVLWTEPEYSITIHGNHSLIFLPPEQILTKTEYYWLISIIDEGGNGPCCITVSLESPDALLYNLTSVDSCTYRIDLYRFQ